MADQVTQILTNAQSPDMATRQNAEQQLEQAKESNFPMFMMTMVTELATEGKPAPARMLAGLLMKNALYAKSQEKCAELQQKWIQTVDQQTNTNVKAGCLQTLQSPNKEVRNQACQVISKIALCELPNNGWPTLISTLKECVVSAQDLNAKHGSLVSLGYICQEISDVDSECLDAQANDILTAVIQGMRKEEPDHEMRLAAVQALGNALQFAESNFDRDQERNYIMTQLCECTTCPEPRVRKEAMDCLAAVAYYYYRHLPEYVQAISQITLKAIKEDQEEVGTNAMEFWSTIVEEELRLQEDIQNEEAEAAELLNIAKQATSFFVPVLLECLTKATEDDDEDAWTIPKAAAVCLGLFANVVGDEVVDHVMPMVKQHIQSPNWILQDAAVQAFGCVLEGPSVAKLTPWITEAVPLFLDLLVNPQVKVEVRDTTAWVIAAVLEHAPSAVPPEQLMNLLRNVLKSLTDEPRVAVHGCYAIQQLVDYVESNIEDDDPQTTQLSPFTQDLIKGLVECSNRSDADETANGHELFTCAYTALADLIRASGKDMESLMTQLLPVVVQKIAQSLQGEQNAFAQNVQCQCCAVMQCLCTKIPAQALVQQADSLMQAFLAVFKSNKPETHEEALMGIGALALAMDQQFIKYMPHLHPPLLAALENTDDFHVCNTAVGLVGDITRALQQQFSQYAEEVFVRLMKILMHQHVDRSVKPPIFSTFGDIALAIGPDFVRFMEHCMTMMMNASQTEISNDDPDEVEYANKLLENILEGYSGIVQTLRGADQAAGQPGNFTKHLQNYIPNIIFLLEKKINEGGITDYAVLKAAVNLLGDLCQAIPQIKPQLHQPWVQNLLQVASQNEVGQEDVQFAMRALQ